MHEGRDERVNIVVIPFQTLILPIGPYYTLTRPVAFFTNASIPPYSPTATALIVLSIWYLYTV
jgi:hypothetical protein